MKAQWQHERDMLANLKEYRAQLDSLRIVLDTAQRQGDFNKAAEIRYGEIPNLEQKIKEATDEMKHYGQSHESFLREEVRAEDIAAIVAKWTGTPDKEV